MIPSSALANTTDITIPDDATIELARTVASSDEPEATYLALTETEQRAVDSVLGRPSDVITIDEVVEVDSLLSGCWQRVKTKEGYSLGVFQWRVSQTLYWCGAGTAISSHSSWFNVNTGALWQYSGLVSESTIGGVGWTAVRWDRQVHFQYCPPPFGCFQNEYPTVAQQGSYDGSYWQN